MSSHPVNLAVRFLLELCALVALGYWGWAGHRGLLRVALALGLPLLAALVWYAFALPGDRSRSGQAPVPVPGIVRLAIELALFGFTAWALYDAGTTWLGLILAAVVVVHYVASYDRIAWLLRH